MVVGPKAFSAGSTTTKKEDFTDGTAHTIALVEMSKSGIHWMEPRDLNYDEMSFKINDPNGQGLRSEHPGVVNVLYADGAVRSVRQDVDPQVLKRLFYNLGQEKLDPIGRQLSIGFKSKNPCTQPASYGSSVLSSDCCHNRGGRLGLGSACRADHGACFGQRGDNLVGIIGRGLRNASGWQSDWRTFERTCNAMGLDFLVIDRFVGVPVDCVAILCPCHAMVGEAAAFYWINCRCDHYSSHTPGLAGQHYSGDFAS